MPIDADGLLFSFPDGWTVGKYDEFVFYRKHFSKISDGLKALDLLAIDPEHKFWQTAPYVLTDRDMLSRMCKFVKRYSDAEEGSPMNQDVRNAVVAILLVLVLSCGSRPGSVGA